MQTGWEVWDNEKIVLKQQLFSAAPPVDFLLFSSLFSTLLKQFKFKVLSNNVTYKPSLQ